MRIAIDIRPLLEERRGGIPIYTEEMTRALAMQGRHAYVLFSNAWKQRIPDVRLPSPTRATRYFTHWPNKILNAGFAFLGAPKLEQMIGAFDAVYLPNLHFIATKKPTIVTVHDLSYIHYPQFFTRRGQLVRSFLHTKRALANAAAIVAVSEHTRRDIVETFGVPEERVHVASPGIAAQFCPQSQEEIERVRTKYALPERFYLFLGTLEPRKNITGVIAAHEQTKTDADLVIAGGKGWLYKEIFHRAAVSKKRDHIRFLDYIDEADKPGLYAAALAFVYPSFYEGFGMPPAEAMAVGTPVIASRASSLGEVVGNAGLLVDPYDIREIAGAMDAVAEQTTLTAQLRAQGFTRAKKFTWDTSAAKLAEIFSSLKS